MKSFILIHQDYGKMKEVCVIEDISYHYKLPVLTEEVESPTCVS